MQAFLLQLSEHRGFLYGLEVYVDRIFDRRGVPTGHRYCDGDASLPATFQYHPVALGETLFRHREPAELVAFKGVGSGEEDRQVPGRVVKYHIQSLGERRGEGAVVGPVGKW